ncbi:hypothetical protein M011DRAFT_406811 [Sporormia fimetaria CBS 119925]|uniref:Uncharacterized protein n=1 Tax=Sporormia fimetaria CBS 119925 TaxID=1340428 RepID=A0A6A6V6C8_9PLEO|nr:hypothetical protein M011DRAFT_406811 [Sporormia fimetaria CBS 119925]
MDSMRSLNKSLPKARKSKSSPKLDTLQAFRAAALTVTNLYKSASAEAEKARCEGYQDALTELSNFLDRHYTDANDATVRRLRQWVSERQDGAPAHSSDSDDDVVDDIRATRSPSPSLENTTSADPAPASEAASSDPAVQPETGQQQPQPEDSTQVDIGPLPQQNFFRFTAGHPFPAHDSENSLSVDPPMPARRTVAASRRSGVRSSRTHQRNSAANVSLFSLGGGAGQKRKLVPDFFQLDGFNERRDGPGSGKRGRTS